MKLQDYLFRANAVLATLISLAALSVPIKGYSSQNQDQASRPSVNGSPSTVDEVRSFVNSVAKGIYFAAWPTATYRSVALDDVQFAANGFDASIKLSGKSAFGGGDLWLKLVFVVRNGQLIDIRVGENNAILAQPFQTSATFLKAIKDAEDEYNVEHTNSPDSGSDGGSNSPSPNDGLVHALPAAPIRRSIPVNSLPIVSSQPGQPGPGAVSGEDLLEAIDNSLWIADGNPAMEQLYVLASPCDRFSRSFYATSRAFVGAVQIRWIEEVPTSESRCRNFLGMVARGDAGLLEDVYVTGYRPAAAPSDLEENAVRWNMGVENALTPILRYALSVYGRPLNYPILIWVSNDGVKVAERPSDLANIFASIADRSSAVNLAPMSRQLMTEQFDLKTTDKRAMAKTDGVKLYAMPDERSQVTSTLPKDLGYPIAAKVRIAGESWFELQSSPEPLVPNLFVREADVYKVK
jgi:hypothetical protein